MTTDQSRSENKSGFREIVSIETSTREESIPILISFYALTNIQTAEAKISKRVVSRRLCVVGLKFKIAPLAMLSIEEFSELCRILTTLSSLLQFESRTAGTTKRQVGHVAFALGINNG